MRGVVGGERDVLNCSNRDKRDHDRVQGLQLTLVAHPPSSGSPPFPGSELREPQSWLRGLPGGHCQSFALDSDSERREKGKGETDDFLGFELIVLG